MGTEEKKSMKSETPLRPGVSNTWGDRLSFLGQLEIGGRVACATDISWEWLESPIPGAEIYNGEIFDTALEDASWSTTASSTVPVGRVEDVGFSIAELIAPDGAPVKRIMEMEPKELITTPTGMNVLDSGQDLVGRLKIMVDIPGQRGHSVVVRHAEVLEHGELGTRPLRTGRAENIIHLGGKTKGYESRFPWYGFRYAEITGYDQPALSDFKAIVISSDLRRTGTSHCSHTLINQLHENTVWSTRGNFVSVPTDCPQRDDWLGWTGDIQVFAPTASYLFDTAAFLGEWLQDSEADQRDTGGVVRVIIPKIPIPPRHPENRPMAVWADCSIMTPWDLYNFFGDREMLGRQWESMRQWLDHGVPRNKDGFYADITPQYGDWLDPRSPPQLPGHSPTDPYLVANAYLIHLTGLAAVIAKILTKAEVAATYANKAGELADLFPSYALALFFNLFTTQEEVQTAKARLDWMIRWEAFKIITGFAGTPVFSNGNVGNSMLPDGSINPGHMTSFSHYALGSAARSVTPTRPLTLQTVHILSRGKLKAQKMTTEVTVPPNGEAQVVLNGVDEKVGGGEYSFETVREEDPDWPLEPIQGAQGNEVPAKFVP
ncbi:hypothetical protein diail_4752 [Diaporthe ilicicola]|nr:hypothetical protein diail_4752 [Diaporthe ilicicola]